MMAGTSRKVLLKKTWVLKQLAIKSLGRKLCFFDVSFGGVPKSFSAGVQIAERTKRGEPPNMRIPC